MLAFGGGASIFGMREGSGGGTSVLVGEEAVDAFFAREIPGVSSELDNFLLQRTKKWILT